MESPSLRSRHSHVHHGGADERRPGERKVIIMWQLNSFAFLSIC